MEETEAMGETDAQLALPEIEADRQESAAKDLESKLALVASRCTAARLKVEEKTQPEGGKYLIVNIPNGRDSRSITVASVRQAERLLDTRFERYVVLGDYEAICSYADGVIEAAIRPLDVRMPSSFVWQRLFDYRVPQTAAESSEEAKAIELTPPNGPSDVKVVIGPTSRDLQLVSDRPYPRRQGTSIRISGLRVSQHDTAVEVLEKFSNPIRFELDIKRNIPLVLVRDRRRLVRTRRAISDEADDADLKFPSFEYPQQPMSLYWYARSATGMPLLQYLAYYQALEFFFPIY
jgi:hypothetical protein